MVNKKLLMDAVTLTKLDPSERLALIRSSGTVLLEYVGGSHAYGTSLPASHLDRRGVFCMPKSEYTGVSRSLSKGQISDDRKIEGQKAKNDDIFYTLHRLFELLSGSNPNVLEALYLPQDCVVSSSPEIEMIIANRHLFISKACIWSHCGYAKDQLGKMRGKGKKVMNPWPEERPKKTDFCRIISCVPGTKPWTNPDVPSSRFPFRPIDLKDMPWVNLSDYHVASVEHMKDAYRMYYYGEESKGVFRGDDMLVCESIPMDDEWPRFSGILLYDEVEYERAVKDWKSYWDWISNRNISRWVGKDETNFKFDHKNAMHCMRLLMSGLNIVKNGEPIVRFHGDQLQYLMDIRNGKTEDHNIIMEEVQKKMDEINTAAEAASLPDDVNKEKIEALYSEVSELAWKRLYGG